MKKYLTSFTTLILFTVLFFACDSTEPDQSSSLPVLELNEGNLTVTSYSGTCFFLISNVGGGELSWEITGKPEWLDFSKLSGNITNGSDTVYLFIDNDLEIGEYSGTIRIESNGGNTNLNINYSYTGWERISNMPTARCFHTVAEVNGKIYVIGGSISGNSHLSPEDIVSFVDEYNPETDQWTRKSDMQTQRCYFSSTVYNNKIYAIGGYSPETLSSVEVYDPSTDTWTTKASMINQRWGHGTCLVNGKIYVIGGADRWPANFISTTEEYDPEADSWRTKSSMPSERWLASCCAIEGKIYVIGGMDPYGTVSSVEEYSPATDSWSTKNNMTTPRWGLTTASFGGKIYAIGGGYLDPPHRCYDIVEEYNPATNSWTTINPLPVSRVGHAPESVTIESKLYIIGGGGPAIGSAHSDAYVFNFEKE